MTNKAKLQAEILAKIKEGIKPSDLKKTKTQAKAKKKPNPSKSPNLSPYVNGKDDGYESDSSNKSIPTAPPLPKSFADSSYISSQSEVYKENFATNTEQKLLQQISSLKKQLQLYKDFREGDLRIKEQYKETITDLTVKNSELNKTIDQLKNQSKSTADIKPEPVDMTTGMRQVKTFTCSDCQQEKPQSELSRVFGSFFFCLNCSKKARQTASEQKQKPNPVDFICHLCEQSKQEIPHKIKLDQTLTEYLICGSCKPTAKEFNEAELITDELWEKYPYSSASEILELEFGIKSRKE